MVQQIQASVGKVEHARKHIVAGILAHVDAGKTTLSEALLYETGKIRKFGRVDHADTYLDTNALERERGITMVAHQTQCSFGDLDITLLDTPGHVDFGAETERVISVLDYALLVVSATDGVQSHTQTLWQLLRKHHVPTFIVLNKIDAPGVDLGQLEQELRNRLSSNCIIVDVVNKSAEDKQVLEGVPQHGADLPQHTTCNIDSEGNVTGDIVDDIALCSEKALEEALESQAISSHTMQELIAHEQLFAAIPVSALQRKNIQTLLALMEQWCIEPSYGQEFGAKVFKISHDAQHARLTWLKITGGSLPAKTVLTGAFGQHTHSNRGTEETRKSVDAEGSWTQKVDQLRVYDADHFTIAQTVPAGTVCAVTGLTYTTPGMGLGYETSEYDPQLQPVMNYTVIPSQPTAGKSNDAQAKDDEHAAQDAKKQRERQEGEQENAAASTQTEALASLPRFDDMTLHRCLTALYEYEDEDPLLHVQWVSQLEQIQIQCMGTIQQEVLISRLHNEFGLDVACVPAGIIYKESISAAIEGVGHFEPLRHYAEVHVRIEPNHKQPGITYASQCDPNTLSSNWRNLIMTHLKEREHKGVLIGAPLTDVTLTLLAGRGHEKHTEGGDFRQATYRAVRQGLMCARERGECVLLEPWYSFTLEIPAQSVGRALSDIQRMHGQLEAPSMTEYGTAIVQGACPVATMHEYATEVAAYTHGEGRLSCVVDGYRPCHNADAVIASYQYDPVADIEHTPDSVFCAHGAGYPVSWDKVPEHMHIDWVMQQ